MVRRWRRVRHHSRMTMRYAKDWAGKAEVFRPRFSLRSGGGPQCHGNSSRSALTVSSVTTVWLSRRGSSGIPLRNAGGCDRVSFRVSVITFHNPSDAGSQADEGALFPLGARIGKARALPPVAFQRAEAGSSEPWAPPPFDPVKGEAIEIQLFLLTARILEPNRGHLMAADAARKNHGFQRPRAFGGSRAEPWSSFFRSPG